MVTLSLKIIYQVLKLSVQENPVFFRVSFSFFKFHMPPNMTLNFDKICIDLN